MNVSVFSFFDCVRAFAFNLGIYNFTAPLLYSEKGQLGFMAELPSVLCVTVALTVIFAVNAVYFVILMEKQRNAPDTRKSYYNVDYSCEKSFGTSCNPGNEVEGEKTDKTPVQRSDYRNNQRDFVYKHS